MNRLGIETLNKRGLSLVEGVALCGRGCTAPVRIEEKENAERRPLRHQ